MLVQDNNCLGATFKEYFEIVPAFTDKLKAEAYRIRHQVYCEDLKFEQLQPQGLEIDEYDQYSLHLLIYSHRTNEFIACTRIIRPECDNPYNLLPFEKNCSSVIDLSIVNPQELPRHSIAEVSRLAVTSNYRRRKNEKNSAIVLSDTDFGPSFGSQPQLQPRFPYIPLGLYFGTTALAHLHGIDTLFVLTEERLANHLNKLGFGLRIIGKAIDHHGSRVPSMMKVKGIIDGMKPILRPLYNIIAADIEKSLKSESEKNIEVTFPKYQKLSFINLHA